jgi:hypothetical protein
LPVPVRQTVPAAAYNTALDAETNCCESVARHPSTHASILLTALPKHTP